MDKTAIFDSMTPAQMVVASLLLGSGGFAGGKLLHDFYVGATKKKPEAEKTLELDFPMQEQPKLAQAMPLPVEQPISSPDGDSIQKLIIGLGLLPVGFMGTKGIYDYVRKKQTDSEINDAKQQYLHTLQSVKAAEYTEKVATPVLDGFIDGYIPLLEKAANNTPWRNARNLAFGDNSLGNAASTVSMGLSDDAGNAWGALALLSAVLSGGAFMMADNRRQSGGPEQFPTAVKVNPVHFPEQKKQESGAGAMRQPSMGLQ